MKKEKKMEGGIVRARVRRNCLRLPLLAMYQYDMQNRIWMGLLKPEYQSLSRVCSNIVRSDRRNVAVPFTLTARTAPE